MYSPVLQVLSQSREISQFQVWPSDFDTVKRLSSLDSLVIVCERGCVESGYTHGVNIYVKHYCLWLLLHTLCFALWVLFTVAGHPLGLLHALETGPWTPDTHPYVPPCCFAMAIITQPYTTYCLAYVYCWRSETSKCLKFGPEFRRWKRIEYKSFLQTGVASMVSKITPRSNLI